MKAGSAEGGQPPPQEDNPNRKANRGISIADPAVRVFAALGTLSSAMVMGMTNQTLPIVSQFFMFRAQYNDLPTFTFFVVTNAIVCAYLVLSLALSIFHIIKSTVKVTRLVLVIFDTVMLALLTAGASAAAAIVYLAHRGNAMANWSAICRPYSSFCERISGSLVGSYVAIIALLMLVILSTIAISRC